MVNIRTIPRGAKSLHTFLYEEFMNIPGGQVYPLSIRKGWMSGEKGLMVFQS